MLRHLVPVLALAFVGMGLTSVTAVAQSSASAARQATATPEQVITTIADELADKLEGRRQELKNNKAELIQVINSVFLPHFDIDYAAILVLGRHARQATPAQRARFAKAFYNSITQRYAEGLLNYTRGAVTVLPFRGELNDRRTIVRTQINLNGGKTLAVNYAFHKTHDGQWKAYDIIIEGISYITNYRNQVDGEIRSEGLDALIKRLESQGGQAMDDLQKGAGGAHP